MLILDVSSNNPEPDWRVVRSCGVEAVWLKASEGFTYADPTFEARRRRAARAGLRVGAYHYARADRHPYEPELEARHFCEIVGTVGRRDLRPVLDLETKPRAISMLQLGGWAQRFMQETRRLLGVGPVFYSYSSFISAMGLEKPIGYALWLANYGVNDGRRHEVRAPAPFRRVTCHQYTSKGRPPGVHGFVDLSYARNPLPLLAHPVRGLV